MLIRRAVAEDAQAIHELIITAVSLHRQEDFDEQGWRRFLAPNTVAEISKRLDDSQYLCLVCMHNDKLAGIITMHNHERIYQLFVHPGIRNQGVARRLWQEAKFLCDRAGNSGFYTVKSSTMAVPVYQSFGFRLTDDRRVDNGIAYYPLELECRH